MSASDMQEVVYIEQESKISTLKNKLIANLAELIVDLREKDEFITMCARVESTIRAWYNRQFEEMMQLYQLFDAVDSKEKLERQSLSPAQVDKLEDRFIALLFTIMTKSQYKLLNDQELEIATSGKYMLDFPIEVDPNKLDTRMLKNYFLNHHSEDRPAYAHQYLLFRRGLGLDTTSGLFMNEKLDTILDKLYNFVLSTLRLKKPVSKVKREGAAVVRKLQVDGTSIPVKMIERKRIENMKLSLKTLLGPVTLQEPTFERVILVYRKVTPANFTSDLGDRAIHVKQFHNIPMADLEICLPEKRNPSLSSMDWLQLIISVVGGLYAIIASLERKVSVAYIYAMAVAFLGYLSKLYFTWQASMAKYQNLIMQSMYNKHMDSGMGTLLHLCDDVIQQEVKEVIVAYFVLVTQGKATKQELDERCEELLLEEFLEDIDFDVEDALGKLMRLGIVNKNGSGQIIHQSLKQANEIIGVTTEEFVSRMRK